VYCLSNRVVFDDRKLRDLKRKADKMDHAHVKVGVLSSKGGDAKHVDSDFTLVELIAIHEFGSADGSIPDRAPIRITFETNQEEMAKFTSALVRQMVEKGMELVRTLDLLGQKGVSEIKKTITHAYLPRPLKPDTIARKGSDRPLVDTGQLLNSIQYEVSLNGDGDA